ncbi:MAG TPA: glycosyl hydrolase [bacterium]|nr:glycosyl hydrolase [bacterium]HNF86530.1 glycosyl hydrolase [bacterium]HNH28423.1 glycosyl hydrolase [bacterium]HNH31584.1 glycosyl hydrolase [bacterium]HNO89491.1 glycosyl hydrolase [bacterium]
MNLRAWLMLCSLLISTHVVAQKKNAETKDPMPSSTFGGLKFRSVGPALTSGRVVDFAVNPKNIFEYYVAVASGGVWKTTNAGVTYEPVFDGEGSYSIGCVAIDPSNPNVVWVGSGENNNQRAVAYGDGIYKSVDGGKSWTNMGLKNSEHIGRIAIDPNNSDIVYVAAYGPVWSAGGDRGIYKTTDGGKTWKAVLTVSENTGFNEVIMDPRNSNVLYAAAHQRRRSVFTYIGGGPESALYKSTDGGANWRKINSGLPAVDLGRIGIAISPINPDVLYAIVEAAEGKSGVFRSDNRGESWEKRGNNSSSGNYYQEIFCDPQNIDKVYYVDLFVMLSLDGGKSFNPIGEKYKHVDNHALWINPANTGHMLVGCDGGIYETYDNGANWEYKWNLPVTQFYKVATDNATPFYYIYGGTQDNNSIGGPSRTLSANGIINTDWFITNEGDGFESQIDPFDANIVYAQSQYGGLVRYDKKSGEVIDIKPVEGENESGLRWNWDAPLLVSRHKANRLYFGANILFRSDDRGHSWKAISKDMSRGLDRNKLSVMGRVWSIDAVAKNGSTDIYGQLVSIAESPLDENVLYTGTDDGLIHVSRDGGASWTVVDNIPGVPERTYVNQIIASQHDKGTVYAIFNHHRYGDFKPYIFRSRDFGKTWSAIQNNLPERGSVYCVGEDHMRADLLFVGTEFGVFFTIDGGQKWVQLKSGLPTIAVRDLEIQRRENDLVLGTFGRGFYVLDDYTPLRHLKKEDLSKEAMLYPVKDALMFIESRPLGLSEKSYMGENLFSTPNPTVGAVFTYYLAEDIKTVKEKRRASEKEKASKSESVFYPSMDSLKTEELQTEPTLIFTIKDDAGRIVRRLKAPAKKGMNRITWDFRYPSPGPVTFNVPVSYNFYDVLEKGHVAMPGNYSVTMGKIEDGKYTELTPAQSFKAVALNASALSATDKNAFDSFAKSVSDWRRQISSADAYRGELAGKIKFMKAAALDAVEPGSEIIEAVYTVERRLKEFNLKLNGDNIRDKYQFERAPSVSDRIGQIEFSIWNATAAPTETQKQSLAVVAKQTPALMDELKSIDTEIKRIESMLERGKAPYTPGRMPEKK